MGKIILVTGMLGNNSRAVIYFKYSLHECHCGCRRRSGDDGKHKAGCGVRGNG